jgi:hypothetical protein
VPLQKEWLLYHYETRNLRQHFYTLIWLKPDITELKAEFDGYLWIPSPTSIRKNLLMLTCLPNCLESWSSTACLHMLPVITARSSVLRHLQKSGLLITVHLACLGPGCTEVVGFSCMNKLWINTTIHKFIELFP